MDSKSQESTFEIPEMDEVLEKALIFIQDEAKNKLIEEGEIIPFTAMIARDVLFVENHPGDTSNICIERARNYVRKAKGARGYVFCYDGYVETTEGQMDAIIIEGGTAGAENGFVIARIYEVTDEGYVFDDDPVYLDVCNNFMKDLPLPTDEGEQAYLDRLSEYYPVASSYDIEETDE